LASGYIHALYVGAALVVYDHFAALLVRAIKNKSLFCFGFTQIILR
jgi:hypothetical protein